MCGLEAVAVSIKTGEREGERENVWHTAAFNGNAETKGGKIRKCINDESACCMKHYCSAFCIHVDSSHTLFDGISWLLSAQL